MEITITVPDRAVPKLQRRVDRTNRATQGDLTLGQWLELHLRELAIEDDLTGALDQLRREHESDAKDRLEAAVDGERRRLLEGLDGPAA